MHIHDITFVKIIMCVIVYVRENCIKYDFMAFEGSTNTAFLRPAYQSSNEYRNLASNGVDGNYDWNHKAMTANDDYTPWWKVKLAYPAWIDQVEIDMDTSKFMLYIWVNKAETTRKRVEPPLNFSANHVEINSSIGEQSKQLVARFYITTCWKRTFEWIIWISSVGGRD